MIKLGTFFEKRRFRIAVVSLLIMGIVSTLFLTVGRGAQTSELVNEEFIDLVDRTELERYESEAENITMILIS
jgi:hypothetical protein